MGLDRFMGTEPEKKPKKKSSRKKTTEKKTSKKKTGEKKKQPPPQLTSDTSKPIVQQITPSKQDLISTKPASFSFITKKYKCSKCKKYEKMMKRPKTFTPTEKDLTCPKCGGQLKITKK